MTPSLSLRATALVGTSDSTKCSHCGAAFDARGWERLELVELVATERVREHVTHWPSGARIEVRRCHCGRTLARKAMTRER
jgi:hypothetical protein